jgi:gliding motility-associated-like protein
LTINATVLGHFNSNYVIIDNGLQYCPDTIRLKNNILVRGPQLAFTAPAEICLSKPYTVLNSSKPFIPTDIINQWHWDYGIPGQADSVFQPAPYFYPYWGMPFNVKLTAVDINGCMDTLVKPVYVYDIPFLRTIPDVDTLCAGQSATLIAFHNDDITWFPANGLSCVTCDTVIANPSVTTTYYIKATSRFNCSVTDSIMITVFTPFNAVTTKPQNYICAGEMIQLDVKPGMKKVRWYPATGLSDSTVFNPVCLPQHSMTYTATLTDSAGCFSSNAVVNVHVKSLPTVDAGNNQTYPFNTQYQLIPAYSSNVRSYAWEPSDLLTCNNCAFPYGIDSKSQSYLIKVTSDSGCVATDEIAIFVECKYANLLLPTAFTPNRDQLNDYFYPISRGIKKITHFSIYSREGILVFDARDMLLNNPASGWNGTYKGMPQSASSYVYSLEAICETGETIYKKGSFVLLR